MKKRIVFISSFVLIFILHMAYSIWKLNKISSAWAGQDDIALSSYFNNGSYWLGYSYALAGALAAYGLVRFLENNKQGLKGLAGGVSLVGAIYLLGCFLIGCCGSPMLPIYLSLFGSSFLKFTKPLTAVLTTVFIFGGFLWMNRAENKKRKKDKEFFKQQFERIEEISRVKKCAGCSCYMDILKEYHDGVSQSPGNDDLKKKIEELIRATEIDHECLGCEPCHPVGVSNKLFEYKTEIDGNECCPACGDANELSWPVEAGEYLIGRKNAPIAVSTLTSMDLPERISNEIGLQNIAIIGKTETENIGVEKVVKNIVANPYIRFLLVCGKDGKGHQSGKTLLALKKYGINNKKKVIKSPGLRPVLKNVHHDEVRHFREQVSVIDLIESEEIALIRQTIDDCIRNQPEPLKRQIKLYTVQRTNAEEQRKLLLDSAGFFIIYVEAQKNKIVMEHYDNERTLTKVIQGEDATSIVNAAIELNLVSQLDHAAYLGRELTRAETALKKGIPYVQDRAVGEVESENLLQL